MEPPKYYVGWQPQEIKLTFTDWLYFLREREDFLNRLFIGYKVEACFSVFKTLKN